MFTAGETVVCGYLENVTWEEERVAEDERWLRICLFVSNG